jgi:drug/metabolite transporter (DMT)-like permease
MVNASHRGHGIIAASLVLAVVLWGASNAGVKFILQSWPPIWTGGTRFLCAGLLMMALLRWTNWLGRSESVRRDLRRQLWWRSGLSLAVYIVAFNWAVRLTAVSHVALYLGASPVWALLWEGRTAETRWQAARRYGAAALALAGVVVLFWPTLFAGRGHLVGELLGLSCSVLWTHFGCQCRALGAELPSVVLTAHTMWRAGVLLMPLGLVEVALRGIPLRPSVLAVQSYCIVGGGIAAFALWNSALRRWKTSEVYLFNNLIPMSTMLWAHFCLGEPMTQTFWAAMALVVLGVLLGQARWEKFLAGWWLPGE